MYGYLFVHITLHGFFSEFSLVRGGGNDGTVSTGCGSPSVLHPWMLLLHMQETALWIPPVCCVLDDICKRQLLWILRGAFCPLEGGPRHIGTDTLAPVLHRHGRKFHLTVGGDNKYKMYHEQFLKGTQIIQSNCTYKDMSPQ